MKKYVLLLLFLLCGCASFGKGVASAFLDKQQKKDTRVCELKGTDFEGIDYYFKQGNTLKVMMVHGVGSHKIGYSSRLQDNLSKSLGLNVSSRLSKEISLLSPKDNSKVGKLLIKHYQNQEKTKNMVFYELTWSEITQPQKNILSYDSSKIYAYKRAEFNQAMKKFLNDTAPDPLIYLSDKKYLILDAFKQAECWILGYGWDNLPNKATDTCKISRASQLSNLENEKIVFITHSLGSKILIDSFASVIKELEDPKIKENFASKKVAEALQNKKFTVFMLANQLPILQIGSKAPSVVGQYDQYCLQGGEHYEDRIFKGVNIVAFSDPNDILSYDIPPKFVDSYIDSRMCPKVTNVNINIAKEISAFGVGVVNPLSAHTDYDNDQRIIDIISYGADEKHRTDLISKRCSFSYIK